MQLGLSPKVALPALLLALLGIALTVLGIVFSDDTLRAMGYTTLGSALVGLGVGYHAPPGDVVGPKVGEGSDAAMSSAVVQRLPPAP